MYMPYIYILYIIDKLCLLFPHFSKIMQFLTMNHRQQPRPVVTHPTPGARTSNLHPSDIISNSRQVQGMIHRHQPRPLVNYPDPAKISYSSQELRSLRPQSNITPDSASREKSEKPSLSVVSGDQLQ
jgi:hypothetical protein